jgi:hypothetical protein
VARFFGIVLTMVALLACVHQSGRTEGAAQQQTGKPSDVSAGQQPPTVEGKWLLTYDYRGEHKTRIFTLERNKKGRLTATENEPVYPCDVIASFKGNKLIMKVTPHGPIRAANLPGAIVVPTSTIFEAKVNGDTMKGKFYPEGMASENVLFTGQREAIGKTNPD